LPQANIVGQIAPGDAWGLRIQGSYGPLWVCESYYIPSSYFALACTRGPDNPLNPIGVRSHHIPAYQGLRIIPGTDQRYPLVSSFFQRSVGLGARHRGAAVVMQIKATGNYQTPMIPDCRGYVIMAFETREEFQRRVAYEYQTQVGQGLDNQTASERSEFSWGAGIDPPWARSRFVSPEFGGRYRGTTPGDLVPYMPSLG
jgi:hypothetical protein